MLHATRLPLWLPICALSAFLAACNSATPTPTPVPTATITPTPTLTPTPTATPTPEPSPTPACAIVCDIGTEEFGIAITCESGEFSTTLSDSRSYDGTAVEVELNQLRLYENSGNSYAITGRINVDPPNVSYRIRVAGGVFGDQAQVCEK